MLVCNITTTFHRLYIGSKISYWFIIITVCYNPTIYQLTSGVEQLISFNQITSFERSTIVVILMVKHFSRDFNRQWNLKFQRSITLRTWLHSKVESKWLMNGWDTPGMFLCSWIIKMCHFWTTPAGNFIPLRLFPSPFHFIFRFALWLHVYTIQKRFVLWMLKLHM